MTDLKAVVLSRENTPKGKQAVLLLVEPNGDLHAVKCICRHGGGTEIGEVGNGSVLTYLNQRYGDQTVWALCRAATP